MTTAPPHAPSRVLDESGAAPIPHVVIRRSSGWSALRLGEVWTFRDLLFTLAARDLKVRYKQTALGAIWVVLQPLLGAGVFSFVFGTVADFKAPGGMPYFLFSYVGLQSWALFSGTLAKSGGSLVNSGPLIGKVYFPRLILPLSSLPSTFVDFGVAGVMLVALLAWFHVAPGWGVLLLPVWITMLLAAAMGIGLVTAALAVTYRDVLYILPLLDKILMWGSPVAYGVERVPERLRFWYYVNPLAAPIEAFRWSVLGVGEIAVGPLVYSAALSAALLIVGAFAFKRMERRFADMI